MLKCYERNRNHKKIMKRKIPLQTERADLEKDLRRRIDRLSMPTPTTKRQPRPPNTIDRGQRQRQKYHKRCMAIDGSRRPYLEMLAESPRNYGHLHIKASLFPCAISTVFVAICKEEGQFLGSCKATGKRR